MVGGGRGVLSEEARRHLRFHLIPEIGPIRFRRLVDHFGDPDLALKASDSSLRQVEGIGPVIAGAIQRARGEEAVNREIEDAERAGIRILCSADADYPALLRHIPDPPICLYVRGVMTPTDAVALAVVGTRRCSFYGKEQAVRFGAGLAGAGLTVVSGLARGVDGHAHRGALQSGGRTLAVLGNGFPSIYPSEHEDLANEITVHGAVVTEVPMGVAPTPESFPRRNRILAGLSLGVLVVEADSRSGALITARLAIEYNREVFALPGRIDQTQYSSGVNALIRDGHAKLVTCVEDVLSGLGDVGRILGAPASNVGLPTDPTKASGSVGGDRVPAGSAGPAESNPSRASEPGFVQGEFTPVSTGHAASLSSDDRALYEAVREGAGDLDAILQRTNMGTGPILASLTRLEMAGWIRALPGGRFEIRSPAVDGR